MAKIPEYGRRPSESAAVGTPGVDLSGAKIAEAVGGVAETALKARLEKHKLIDTAEGTKRLIDFDTRSLETTNAVLEEGSAKRWSEEQIRDEARRRLSKDAESLGNGLRSPEVKSQLNLKAYEKVSKRSLEAYQSALKISSARAKTDVLSSANKLANNLSSVFADPNLSLEEKMQQLNETIQLAQQVADASKLIYNQKEHANLRQSLPKMLSKASLLGSIDSKPDEAEILLKSGEFDYAFDTEEKKQWMERIKERKLSFQKIAQENATLASIQKNGELFQRFEKGELSLAEIENLDDDVTQNLLRDAYLKIHPATKSPERSLRYRSEFLQKREAFWDFDKNGNAIGLKKDFELEDVVSFQRDALKAYKNGALTKSELLNYGTEYVAMIADAARNEDKSSPIVKAWISARNAITKSRLSSSETEERISRFMQRLANGRIDINDPKQVIEGIRETNPNYSKYDLGKTIHLKGVDYTVTGYDDDGEPIVEVVRNAKAR